MRITQVEPQKKSANRWTKRFNIFLDGQFAFGVDEDLVVDQRLVVGKEVNEKDLEKLLFDAQVGKLMERMYSLFNIRQRSEKEIRDYLRKLSFKRKVKGGEEISEMVVEQLIDKLKQKKLLDDKEFARAWVNARSKKKGKNVIKAELFKKGIDREIIEEVISVKSQESWEEDVAQTLLEKRLPRWSALPYLEKKKKAYEFLLRRGFEYSTCKEVVEKILTKG